MKTKYCIAQAAAHGRWSYMSPPRTQRNGDPIINDFQDRFLMSDTQSAQMFDTKLQAKQYLDKCSPEVTRIKKGATETITKTAFGIYKIEEIFIIE